MAFALKYNTWYVHKKYIFFCHNILIILLHNRYFDKFSYNKNVSWRCQHLLILKSILYTAMKYVSKELIVMYSILIVIVTTIVKWLVKVILSFVILYSFPYLLYSFAMQCNNSQIYMQINKNDRWNIASPNITKSILCQSAKNSVSPQHILT